MKKRPSEDDRILLMVFDRRNALRAKAFYDDDALEAGEQPAPNTLHWKIARYEQLIAAFRLMKASPAVIDRYEAELYRLYKQEYRRYKIACQLGTWSLN